MKFFGLLSVLITIAIAAWWITSMSTKVETAETSDGSRVEVGAQGYTDMLDSAQDAANSMER